MELRKLTSHSVNPANEALTIEVVDQPGAGGANHVYLVSGPDVFSNPGFECLSKLADERDDQAYFVLFQNGTIPEAGVNGLTHEVLLAIIIDRLESFQAGPFANQYNQTALVGCRAAQSALLQRTVDRMERGVEGTHTI
jgi:hypothetical protein